MKKLLLTILVTVVLPLTAATAAPLGASVTKHIPVGGSATFTFTNPVPAGYYHCREQTRTVTFRAVSTDYAVVRDNPSKDPKDHAPITPSSYDAWAVMASNSLGKTGRLEFTVYPEKKYDTLVRIRCWGQSDNPAIPYKCGNPPNKPPTCAKKLGE